MTGNGPLVLVIGDKQLSSWSLRPWLLMRHLGLPFEELRLPLDTPRFVREIGRYSPAGRVPVLLHGELHVWDSLAICEYVNELVRGAAWPTDAAARAHARSISAEMHSGFTALRSTWTMRAASLGLEVELTPAALADVGRVEAIWTACRERYEGGGPWLFGARFCIADAMYAPVALRFRTYGATLGPVARRYAAHLLDDPHVLDWIRGAEHEIASEGRPESHA